MEKALKISEITADLKGQAQNLKSMTRWASELRRGVQTINGELEKIDQIIKKREEKAAAKLPKDPSKIIPFPEQGLTTGSSQGEPPFGSRILARPGSSLPLEVFDYSLLLQRDGLILLGWDKRTTEMGERYTAYWVTSSGVSRFYASKQLSAEDFISARPNHKSYAAEDGIEFYGQCAPDYIVHVAPELMMSNNQKLAQRPEHIKKLRALGIGVDFDYSFLLTVERKKRSLKQGNKRGA